MVIAIDGFSACGKSSTAKQVARKLAYCYLDSGAMYRAVTYFFLKEQVDLNDARQVEDVLNRCVISFEGETLLLNGEVLRDELRTMEVNHRVSVVSTIPEVRKALVSKQQSIGKEKGIVMDGRDIGTVVFPGAELKVFMTADMNIRASRRVKEQELKGIKENLQEIITNLSERDRRDATRDDSPLKKTEDAIAIDTSHLVFEEQVDKIVRLAKERMKQMNG